MSGSGSRNNNEKDNKEGEGSGWASTFFQVAGAVAATAAVAGSLYSILNQPEADVAPYRVQQTHHHRYRHDDDDDDEEEEVILRVDGSLLPQSQSASCGGFLSSASKKWICGFAQKLDPNSKVDETEKQAILKGLLWVKEKGMKKVAVKTDNEGVAYTVKFGESDDDVIKSIRNILNSDGFTISWISGRENAVADRLAHIAHGFTSFDLQEIHDPPQNCRSLIKYN